MGRDHAEQLRHLCQGVTRLGEQPQRGKERLIAQILEHAGRTESTLVLIVDDAHLLDRDALTDLRLLVSSEIDKAPSLKILLVGQETLLSTLKQSQHQALLNRNCQGSGYSGHFGSG